MPSLFRNHKYKTKKDALFLRNGAAMLEQLIHSFDGSCNPIRMYSVKELKKATNEYHWDGQIVRDSNFRMYKGLHEDYEILVKKFEERAGRTMDPIELITNEIAIASNMSKHKNVLKLLGCCLETELPTLVYEFPGKGNLCRHISGDGGDELPWQIKLKIAIQVADAVAYLHYGTPKMIVHRDIKTEHVFLDQDYVAKLSEFQISVPIPSGKTHVHVAIVAGTLGFIAPEYLKLGCVSEKSDVYNFGILLLQLFAGRKFKWGDVLISNESENKEFGDLCKVYLETNVLEEENIVVECAKLVETCLKTNPDDRPIMTEVAQSLRLIKSL